MQSIVWKFVSLWRPFVSWYMAFALRPGIHASAWQLRIVIRRAVAHACKAEVRLDGKIEVDESYVGGSRNHCGVELVGLLTRRQGRVHT